MDKIDFTKMSLEDVVSMRDDANAEIQKRHEAAQKEFKDEIIAKAKRLGLDLIQMFGKARVGRPPKSKVDGSRSSPAPKYASLKDRSNPSKRWSGRGPHLPKWMQEEMKQDKKLRKEDFLINKLAA